MRVHGSRVPLLAILAGSMLLVLIIPSASAVPAFSRKYETACQTCHVGFPKLNPFGEAFRNIQNILEKLEVHSKAEAVAFAFQKNLI